MAKRKTPTKNWEALTNKQKLDYLSEILTIAASDLKIRDRCLASPRSAKEVLRQFGDVAFPPDFEVEFITEDEASEKTDRVIMVIPPYDPPPLGGVPKTVLAEDSVRCTYTWWLKSRASRPKRLKRLN